MASSYTLPSRTSPLSPSPQTFSPPVLSYLKAIASNKRPLPAEQLQEFREYTSKGQHHAEVDACVSLSWNSLRISFSNPLISGFYFGPS